MNLLQYCHSVRITVRVFTGLSFQQPVLLTLLTNTLAIEQKKFSGSADAGFVLALSFHHGDLEADCVGFDKVGGLMRGLKYLCKILR